MLQVSLELLYNETQYSDKKIVIERYSLLED